ncbi:hypothetical protein HJC23_007908 [Cyclotella cryptica]|uniref:Dimethylargininase n=1 Tax=Cyclotella cryptica TaxID=29204 RepID=A0ABD3R0C5_9STRA
MQALKRASKRLTRSSHTMTSTATTTMAIARQIPNSFLDALSDHSGTTANDAVSLSKARMQHDRYLQELRRHVPTLCLPALEPHPDCAFVEDTVVAVGNIAVITRLGHESRRGEVDSVKEALCQLGVHVVDMGEEDAGLSDRSMSRCDGGDVLYTGRHLFVGLSERTNQNGFRLLQKVFSERLHEGNIIAVPPVIQGKDVLHLKSAVTHLDEHTILAPEGPLGDNLLQTMKSSERGYTAIRLPDVLSCNAVVVNGHVLAQNATCEVSRERIKNACSERGLGLTFVDTSELAKKDAALTCCSVLLAV